MAASESLLALRRRADRGHQRAPRVRIYDRWLRAHFEMLFEAELEEVVHGSALVAAKRTWKRFANGPTLNVTPCLSILSPMRSMTTRYSKPLQPLTQMPRRLLGG